MCGGYKKFFFIITNFIPAEWRTYTRSRVEKIRHDTFSRGNPTYDVSLQPSGGIFSKIIFNVQSQRLTKRILPPAPWSGSPTKPDRRCYLILHTYFSSFNVFLFFTTTNLYIYKKKILFPILIKLLIYLIFFWNTIF